jgi:hypothetical protein
MHVLLQLIAVRNHLFHCTSFTRPDVTHRDVINAINLVQSLVDALPTVKRENAEQQLGRIRLVCLPLW